MAGGAFLYVQKVDDLIIGLGFKFIQDVPIDTSYHGCISMTYTLWDILLIDVVVKQVANMCVPECVSGDAWHSCSLTVTSQHLANHGPTDGLKWVPVDEYKSILILVRYPAQASPVIYDLS